MEKSVWSFKPSKKVRKHLHEIRNNTSLKLAMLETQTQGELLLVLQKG